MSDVTERPVPPGDNECCESGCSPCVWDHYYEEMNAWQAQEAERIAREKAAAEAAEKV